MKISRLLSLSLASLGLCFNAMAQQPDSTLNTPAPVAEEEEFDFSDFEAAEEVKAFASSRILGGGPQNLFYVGYDRQFGHQLTAGALGEADETKVDVNSVEEFRIDAQYPLISKNNITLALQFNYLRTMYDMEGNTNDHPLLNTLNKNGLTSTSFSTIIFKPLSLKNFLLFQAGVTSNGTYSLSSLDEMGPARISAAAIYGWKPNDRKMWGLGISRTYLGGALNYLPVLYYQYSSDDGKYGIDALLPSRLNLKRYFTPQSILSAGFNFQGNTYELGGLNVNGIEAGTTIMNPELRRSELRFRFVFEKGLTKTLWATAQAGLRYNWEFNVDEKDFFRSLFAEDAYLSENTLENPLFFQVGLSWVSP